MKANNNREVMNMRNMPEVKMGLVAVSRDCFPIELSRKRLGRVAEECRKLRLNIFVSSTIVQSEDDALAAIDELKRQPGVNAVAIYLGNFGPEGPETILGQFAENLGMPIMLCGAAEESGDDLINGRGDAFCGMLSACLNAGLRGLKPHIPPKPVGLPHEVAKMIMNFVPVARVVLGIQNLKGFSFGPRPQDFYACNAPIQPLYNLGVEVMESSELDMLQLFRETAAEQGKIQAIATDMARELGSGNQHPEKLAKLAQFELALMKFFEKNLGSRQFGVFANKCWPGFEKAFGFVPCFVNSRLASQGIPAACEVDIYGAVSEYMAQLASGEPVTLLDVNNTVPDDLPIADLMGVAREDLFMGFHCGNTPSCMLCKGFAMKFQLIMNRLMEKPGAAPDITCGTLEGTIRPGPITIFRLQPTGERLMAYMAEGNVLNADPRSFGGIGIIAIMYFLRFYRYVLLEKKFPHHTAMGFAHVAWVLWHALQMLQGVDKSEIWTPRAPGFLYPNECPFEFAA